MQRNVKNGESVLVSPQYGSNEMSNMRAHVVIPTTADAQPRTQALEL